jgi:hypothetical protein
MEKDKNVIDGLKNKLIKILQQDVSYVMNEAKSIGPTKCVKMYYSETPLVETSSR